LSAPRRYVRLVTKAGPVVIDASRVVGIIPGAPGQALIVVESAPPLGVEGKTVDVLVRALGLQVTDAPPPAPPPPPRLIDPRNN
jgi:hypothetical protein